MSADTPLDVGLCDHTYPPANSDGTCPSCGKRRTPDVGLTEQSRALIAAEAKIADLLSDATVMRAAEAIIDARLRNPHEVPGGLAALYARAALRAALGGEDTP